jgi:hypothetical protein
MTRLAFLLALLICGPSEAQSKFSQYKPFGRDQAVIDGDESRLIHRNGSDERRLMVPGRVGRECVIDATDNKQHDMLVVDPQASDNILLREISANAVFAEPKIAGELLIREKSVTEEGRLLPIFVADLGPFVGQRTSFGSQFYMRPHSEGWSIAHVGNNKGNWSADALSTHRQTASAYPDAINPYPGTLSGDEGRLSSVGRVLERFVSPLHFMQLPLHDRQLPAKNNGADYASGGDGGGQAYHPTVASIYSVYKRLIGYFSLIFVFLTMYGGIYLLFNFDRWLLGKRNTVLLGGVLVIAAIGIACQGVPLIFGY